MNEAYEELIAGQRVLRRPPTPTHETLVAHLHQLVARSLPLNSSLRLLAPRAELELDGQSVLRPDLAVVRMGPKTSENQRVQLYLVAEVLQPGDHHVDTGVKKQVWTDGRLPRLWMVDPRYQNVEVYGSNEAGFSLLDILANDHPLTDPHLPGFSYTMPQIFGGSE
jgi:Putative restriction endonuclease